MRDVYEIKNHTSGSTKTVTRVLILTVPHGAGHQRLGDALRQALFGLRPDLHVDVWNAPDRCAAWFRFYYNSYQILLKYWPGLWGRIERIQHTHRSTGPIWLYWRGAQPLFRALREFDPDTVIATEVGMCELAAMLKRESGAHFFLVAAPGLDIDQAWVQPEVDLYVASPYAVTAQLVSAGAAPARILSCGLPVDPVFESVPDRAAARTRLYLKQDVPVLLVLFGGAGYGKPSRILPELKALPDSVRIICIAGMNRSLEEKLLGECGDDQRFQVFGWVDNIHEWMAAADLLLSKPGETTVAEATAAGLPILAFDPLPGAEQRICGLIEELRIGCWVRSPEHLGRLIPQFLKDREKLRRLQEQARKIARPTAAYLAAQAILNMRPPGRALRIFRPLGWSAAAQRRLTGR